MDNASQVINCIGKCINALGDQEEFVKAWKELTAAHCPYQNEKNISKQHHFKVNLASEERENTSIGKGQ